MPQLVSLRDVQKSHGGRLLFRGVSLSVEAGERIGLIGPNGSGKSTLLRIVSAEDKPDSGDVIIPKGTRVVFVGQTDQFPDGQTVEEALFDALTHETTDDSERGVRVAMVLADCGLDTRRTTPADALSGGGKKRLAIARALVQQPDLLLLDEPTNHLDLDGVLWLEETLRRLGTSTGLIFISHDRYFLENVAGRVVELSAQYPEGVLSSSGGYADFLETRETYLAQQAHREVALSSVARREIEWLRRGAKARTTKAKGRIEAAGDLLGELAETKRRNRENRTASLSFAASGRGTKELVSLAGVSKSLGGRTLFSDLDLGLERKNRFGIIGANGSGKSTLLKILIGELEPDSGTVRRAQDLKVVYFDQARVGLEPETTLRDALSPNSDIVRIGESTMHVSGWAKKFLFRPDQLGLPVGQLSGGERARVLIARLMLQPADVLILDEPTNDLDIPTLDVLEESLDDFPGALVLVTHDRYMLDRVCTQILALDGDGGHVFVSDTAQWEAYRDARRLAETEAANAAQARAKPVVKDSAGATARLSSSERKELKEMEATILAAEERVAQIELDMNRPEIASDASRLNALWESLPLARAEVERLYARWEELESRRT